LILHPVALLLLPALCKSILLVASNSRQLTNSMPGVCSGVIVSEYEFLSRHSTSQSSSSTVEPINNVRMTRSHFALLSLSRCVNVSFRWSSLSPNSASLTQFCAVACDEVRADSRAVNSRRIIGARHLVPTTQSSLPLKEDARGSRPEFARGGRWNFHRFLRRGISCGDRPRGDGSGTAGARAISAH
jgi:hypothetical protein